MRGNGKTLQSVIRGLCMIIIAKPGEGMHVRYNGVYGLKNWLWHGSSASPRVLKCPPQRHVLNSRQQVRR